MPTRIRCTSGTAAVTPTSWIFTQQRSPVTLPGTTTLNTGLAMTSKAESTSNVGVQFWGMGRTVFGPLAAQTISGSVTGQMRAMESNSGANGTLALAIKLVTSAGADRATLLAVTASDAATAGHEFVVNTLTNRPYETAAESTTLTLTQQDAQNGDYLVIEWGFRADTGSLRTMTLSYGNDSATDLTAADTTETAAYNPWWEFSQTLTLAAVTLTIDRSESLSLTTPVFLVLPLLHVALPLSELALSTLRTVTMQVAVRPTEIVALDTLALVAQPLPLGPVTAPLALTESVSVQLPWLTPMATTATALVTTASGRLPLLSAESRTDVAVLDAPDVQRAVPGLLEVPLCTETVALETTGMVQVLWLPAVGLDALAVQSPVFLHVPTLPAVGQSALAVLDDPAVQRAVEGLLEVQEVQETVALATPVLLRVPWLTLGTTSALLLAEPDTAAAPVLVPDVATTLSVSTPVFLRLPLLRPQGTTPLALTDTPSGHLPVLTLHTTDALALTTTPQVLRIQAGVLIPATLVEVLGLTETTPVRVRLTLSITEEVALTSPGMPVLVTALLVAEPVVLEATSLLIVTLYGQSATTVALEDTVSIQANWLGVLTEEPVTVQSAVALRGLAVRGVHATTTHLWTTAMQGSLRQAEVEEPVLI